MRNFEVEISIPVYFIEHYFLSVVWGLRNELINSIRMSFPNNLPCEFYVVRISFREDFFFLDVRAEISKIAFTLIDIFVYWKVVLHTFSTS